MKTLVALGLLALLAMATPASAQEPTGVTLETTNPGEIPFEGSGSIAFSATAGCLDFVTAQGTEATVTLTDAPAWLSFEDVTVEFDPIDCALGQGRAPADGTLDFTVSAAAPAVVSHVVTLQITLGDSMDEATAVFTVAYNSNYTVTPSVTFPLTVTNKTTTFTVTGVQASNAPSMIMVDDFKADAGALVAGIGPLQYNNEAGTPDTKTYTVTFTAPSGDWTTANVTLMVYGHYNFPDGSGAGDPMDQKTYTWEFVNGGVHDDDHEESKKSPAPVGLLTALGLVAFAGLRRKA